MLPTTPDSWTMRERMLAAVTVLNALTLAYILPKSTPRSLHVDVTLTDLHPVFNDFLKDAKYIDLTHAIRPQMPLWAGFNQPTFKASSEKASGNAYEYMPDGFIATEVTLPTDQLGTQLDPPAHWNEYGATISDLPPTVSLRPLVLIDVSSQVAIDPGYHATVDDVHQWEERFGRVPEGAAVLFRSDWSRQWGTYGASSGPDTFPGVSLAALKFLHNERSILVHGHEPLDTDMTPTLEGEEWLLHNNFLQIEGAANLHLLPPSGCLLSIGFAKIQGGAGGYCRLVAVCPKEWASGVTIEEAPAAPLPTQSSPLRRNALGVLVPTEGAIPTRYCAEGDGAWREGCKKP
jgi:kynurenine formamidase